MGKPDVLGCGEIPARFVADWVAICSIGVPPGGDVAFAGHGFTSKLSGDSFFSGNERSDGTLGATPAEGLLLFVSERGDVDIGWLDVFRVGSARLTAPPGHVGLGVGFGAEVADCLAVSAVSVLVLLSRKCMKGAIAARKMIMPAKAISRDEIFWFCRRVADAFAGIAFKEVCVSESWAGGGIAEVAGLSRSRILAITGGHATVSSSGSYD
jgi:hypothetical protein